MWHNFSCQSFPLNGERWANRVGLPREIPRKRPVMKTTQKTEQVEQTEKTIRFGYYPRALCFSAGNIVVSTLPDFSKAVDCVEKVNNGCIHGGWFYSPRQPRPNGAGDYPYNARVFRLPKTHSLTHKKCDGNEHLDFLVWCLGFFCGMRLTTTEAGFVDATPVKVGGPTPLVGFSRHLGGIPAIREVGGPTPLVDFSMGDESIRESVLYADKFWREQFPKNGRIPKTLVAGMHSLYLSEKNQAGALIHEWFMYLYTAFEACYKVAEGKGVIVNEKRRPPHGQRVKKLCKAFGMDVPTHPPDWLERVVNIRHDMFHEGLFMGEPLGFAPTGEEQIQFLRSVSLPMRNLICRFVFALLEIPVDDYIRSNVYEHGLFRVKVPAGRDSDGKS